jgi:serine/threonine protein phosphatase PrpC
MKKHGVIINFNQERGGGTILSQEARQLSFRSWDFKAPDGQPPKARQPVEFTEKPHPTQDRLVAADIRPISKQMYPGTVQQSGEKYGFIRLSNGHTVYFNAQVPSKRLQVGDAVKCMAVPGREGRFFALSVELSADRAGAKVRIGVSTRRGTREGKSLNEDAFLICPSAGYEMWLLALADGVSNSQNGWWASNKCMELIWRTLPIYQERLLPSSAPVSGRRIMREWLNEIHRKFLQERDNAPKEFQQATSTLTFAVVRGEKFFWAHCGDTRLYQLSPSVELSAVISSDDIRRQKARGADNRVGLLNHIAAGQPEWERLILSNEGNILPDKGMLLLCSDGVISDYENGKKLNLLKSLRDFQGDVLQKRVEEITEEIAKLGETDDLTLIAFQPGDN